MRDDSVSLAVASFPCPKVRVEFRKMVVKTNKSRYFTKLIPPKHLR
jgi:hypothetical protein